MNLDLIISIISLVISSFLVFYISRVTWSHNIYIRTKILKDLILVKYYDDNNDKNQQIRSFINDFYDFYNNKTEYNFKNCSSAGVIENMLEEGKTNRQILKLIFTLGNKVRVERHLSIMENYIKDVK